MKVDIPGVDHGNIQEAYTVFTPNNTVNLCKKVLKKVDDYEEMMERVVDSASSLGLAWRIDTQIDWVWHKDDVEGKIRDWAVLYGLALKQVSDIFSMTVRLINFQNCL